MRRAVCAVETPASSGRAEVLLIYFRSCVDDEMTIVHMHTQARSQQGESSYTSCIAEAKEEPLTVTDRR